MDATPEQWRPIPGYEGFYEVSDRGQVKSLERVVTSSLGRSRFVRERILKPGTVGSGHQTVLLCAHGDQTSHRVHALVLAAFVGPRPEELEVCHNNGVPSDNRLANLRYDTRSANRLDAVVHGTHPNTRKTHCKRNHEFTPENTIHMKAHKKRRCKICEAAKHREYLAQKAVEAGLSYTPRYRT